MDSIHKLLQHVINIRSKPQLSTYNYTAVETTIQIKKDLKERLNALKLYPKESYDSVIRRLSELAEDEEPLSKDTIEMVEMSRRGIKEGRVYTTDEVWKRLKIAWLPS